MNPVKSRGISKSWQNSRVRKARAKRHAVILNNEIYGSCSKAFDSGGLDKTKLIPVRKILKIKKRLQITDPKTGRALDFICVPYNYYLLIKGGKKTIKSALDRVKIEPYKLNLDEAWGISTQLKLPR